MQHAESPQVVRKAKIDWVRYGLVSLVFEKIIQHAVVSLAFYFNVKDIDSTIAISPSILMVSGVVVAILFVFSLWGLVARKKWAINLVIALALFDIHGEFVAQGKIGIVITVSFLVVVILLCLALFYRRQTANLVRS